MPLTVESSTGRGNATRVRSGPICRRQVCLNSGDPEWLRGCFVVSTGDAAVQMLCVALVFGSLRQQPIEQGLHLD